MLGKTEQEVVDDFESDFLESGLAIHDLSSCLAGYLKGLLLKEEFDFGNEVIESRFIEFLSAAESKSWPATEIAEKSKRENIFGRK